MNDIRERLAGLLEAVTDGTTPSSEALELIEEWKDFPPNHRLFAEAYEELQHFNSDGDIRVKDASYASHQLASLRSYAKRLRAAYD